VIAIPLTQGKVALIDDCDAHLAQHKWYATRTPQGRWYAQRTARVDDGARKVLLHREALGITDPAVEVDHKDGNGLDCRRHNIRPATPSQNQANRQPARPGLKGVRLHRLRNHWWAVITIAGRRTYLGRFPDAEAAARAYDTAARRLFGEFARLNFPEGT
jgi:hypothetical protein